MFVYIGNNVMIPKKDIVAIFDIKVKNDKNSKSKAKSYIVTSDKCYDSLISCDTLKKRFNSNSYF
ncbi:DUF370 domain-containing protein [Peptococcaceae bacterium]|nr:DUF370 domain-containing protein [Peptococcaceae bacterium]